MSDLLVYERAGASFPATLAQRGHHVVYRANSTNHCPGCGRSQWFVGRISAECGFCGTALPLAEARRDSSKVAGARAIASLKANSSQSDQRRHPRFPALGRNLQLLIDGCPTTLALHNISQSGAMGDNTSDLVQGTAVYVRFEDGTLAPAVVKWTEGGLVGLAFDMPIMLDNLPQPGN